MASEPVWDGMHRRVIPAVPLSRASKSHLHSAVDTEYVRPLGEFPMPEEIFQSIDRYGVFNKANLWQGMDEESEKQRLHSLLWIEEAQEAAMLNRYSLKQVSLRHVETLADIDSYFASHDLDKISPSEDSFFLLEVPGLAENRPSLIQRDKVYAWVDEAQIEFEGIVFLTCQTHVLLLCNMDLVQYLLEHPKMNVRFTLPRIFYRTLHRAVQDGQVERLKPNAYNMKRRLDNSSSSTSEQRMKSALLLREEQFQPISDGYSCNQQQRAAILSIVNQTHGTTPFLLFLVLARQQL